MRKMWPIGLTTFMGLLLTAPVALAADAAAAAKVDTGDSAWVLMSGQKRLTIRRASPFIVRILTRELIS